MEDGTPGEIPGRDGTEIPSAFTCVYLLLVALLDSSQAMVKPRIGVARFCCTLESEMQFAASSCKMVQELQLAAIFLSGPRSLQGKSRKQELGKQK